MTDAPLVRLECHDDVGVIIVNNPPTAVLASQRAGDLAGH